MKKLIVGLVVFFSAYSVNLFAIAKPSHFYLQYNIMTNLGSSFRQDITSTGADGSEKTEVYKMTAKMFDTHYNMNFMVGYHFNSSWATELEFASYEIYQEKIDGDSVGASGRLQAFTNARYQMFNIRYDIVQWGNFTPFVKAGFGVGFFDAPARNSTGYGNDIEAAYQFGVGAYYTLDKYLDFEASYKFFSNIPTKEEVSSTSVVQAYTYVESSLYLGIRLKLFNNF